MRHITNHQINDVNRKIEIQVLDEPGVGGASAKYDVIVERTHCSPLKTRLRFQDGQVSDGVNGLTHETLVAILVDRFKGFQSGPFACQENVYALQAIEAAQAALHSRTRSRANRGVEGTHQR